MTTDELVDEIFGRCRERVERGEHVDVDDVLRAHPDLADALRERFAAASLLDRAGARTRRSELDATARVGRSLGGYRLESVLGAGGMGTVYLASAETASASAAESARVAVKVFHPHLVLRERFTARFVREADLGRRVRHPNVVRTLHAGEGVEADRPVRFLVMELVEGRTLREMLGDLGRLPEELVRHVGREVARGLAAIHAAGAIHRDLKPENVIVTRDHVVKVMDLGVARVDDAATLSESGAFIGSFRYGAPEQVAGSGRIDGRVDLHALGALLFELATGAQLFTGENVGEVVRQILDVRPRRIGELAPQVSPFLEELVAQLLEKDRGKRPATADAVASILADGESSAWWRERAVAMRRETRRPLRRVRIPRETALYGRGAEISRLRGLYERAKSGDGQVVLVEGEAGIGKSRLVDEFVLELWRDGEDIDFLVGSYPPGGAAAAAGGFSTAYREHLGDDEAALREALPQTPLLVPAFAALLRGDVAPAHAEKLTKDSIQTLFVHATRSFAARRTTIVFIDDLQFAPEEGRGLFASLALAAPGHRILLLGGARRSLDAKWSAGLSQLSNASRLSVGRLSPGDLVEVLADALKSRHLAEDLGGRIAVKTDGNPYFVFEILRGLREGQFLTRTPTGAWITTRSIRDIEVPSTIVEVIQARVSGLRKDERELLEAACCVGFEFDAALVGAVLGVAPIPLLQRLGGIEKAHRLVRSVGRLFAFDHHQVQEVLYAGLSAPQREAYHSSIAEAMETANRAASTEPGVLDGALCVGLTEHFLRGGRAERAARYLEAGLMHLETCHQNDDWLRLCDRALAVPGLLAGTARCGLLLRKSERLDRMGRRDAQGAPHEEALALADAANDLLLRARTRSSRGVLLFHLSRYAEAETVLRTARAFARASGDRGAESSILGVLSHVLMAVGRYPEAASRLKRQLALAREAGDRPRESTAMGNLGTVMLRLGRFDEAQEQLKQHIAFAREIGDHLGETISTGNLGSALEGAGRYLEARAQCERQLALARQIGHRPGECNAVLGLARVYLDLGQLDEAREQYEHGIALARELRSRTTETTAVGNLGNVFRALGRFAEATAQHEKQLVIARETSDRREEVFALGNLAADCWCVGRLAEALTLFQQSLGVAREIGDLNSEGYALLRIAELRLAAGDLGAARQSMSEALELVRRVGARMVEAVVLVGLSAVAAEEGDYAEAMRHGEAALALLQILGEGPEAATSHLVVAEARRQAGDLVGARAALEESIRMARANRDQTATALALASLATLPGGDATAAEAAFADARATLWVKDTVRVRLLLWQATRHGVHLAEAKRLLDFMLEHAPPECRETMLTNVRLHREILAAWREHGAADGGSAA